jgi:hypothetical protein
MRLAGLCTLVGAMAMSILSTVALARVVSGCDEADDEQDRAIAMHFYPLALDDDFRDNHAPNVPVLRLANTLRIDLDRTGVTSYLAVAYSNGLAGSLAIIRGTTPTDAVLLAESTDRGMGGNGSPVLDAVDIDNDGVPEVVVQFARATWIYRYGGGRLILFCPSRESPLGLTSNLGWAAFADLDGDGVLEILEAGSSAVDPYRAYRLGESGAFAVAPERVLLADRVELLEEPPAVAEQSFSAGQGSAYVLRVVNGDQRGGARVSGATIRLNGVVIVAPDAFKDRPRTLVSDVVLLERNTLSIELDGPQPSQLSIVIVRVD